MLNYKVLCIDMFETLVCISERSHVIWKRILEDDYTEDLRIKYSRLTSANIVNAFHEVHSISNDFKTLRSIFTQAFQTMFIEENLNRDPKLAAQIFIEEHNNANWYGDSLAFINKMKNHYKICIVTDADRDMIQGPLSEMAIDRVVISEEVQSYKRNPSGQMFKEVLAYFQCQPHEVLHIGDSSSDMYGADAQKIHTCWINRHNYNKPFNMKPNYEIETLAQLEQILAINETE